MATSSESKPERTELSTQVLPTLPTIEEMETWNRQTVLRWILQRDPSILEDDDLDNFRKAKIAGKLFLDTSREDFQKSCSLSYGASRALEGLVNKVKEGKDLADEVNKEGKLSNQTAGTKRKEDEIDSPESPISPKRHRRQCLLSGLATRANEQRKLVREIIIDLNNSSNQHSDSVDPLPGAVAQLSNPQIVHTLPFPFVGSEVPVRFKLDNDAEVDSEAEVGNKIEVDNEAEVRWPYAGRTRFETLVKKLKRVRKSLQLTTVWLYGTQGYGKSHLLAALVCYLAAQDERVVYIPDCRALLKDPVEYVRAAMLFAWANDIPTQKEIMTLNTQEEIRDFFFLPEKVIFVIDQMNALKTSKRSEEAKKRAEVYNWITSLTAGHKSVFSSSANYGEFHDQTQQQSSNLVVYAYGGLDRMEMDEWWKRHSDIDVTDDERSNFEDVTGRIPLLLDKCVVSGKINLNVAALRVIYHKAVGFVQQMRASRKTDQFSWDWYCDYVTACFYHENVPVGHNEHPDLIDHRYFYNQPDEKGDEKGSYTCGLVRDAVADQLLEEGFNFAHTNLLTSLADFVKNKSITGFIIEHAVLSSIRRDGLAIGKGIGCGMALKTLRDCSVKTDVTDKPVLYRPQVCNFAAIDGIIVLIKSKTNEGKKPKLLMVPIQITVQESRHSDSHAAFLTKYNEWTRGLSEFDVELDFVWITSEKRDVKEHEAVWTNPKQRDAKKDKAEPKLRSPKHIERWIPIEDVCAATWRQYQNALAVAG